LASFSSLSLLLSLSTFRHVFAFIHFLQWLHRLDVSLTRSAEGRTGKTFVGDMSEDKAVQLASRVVSEGFVYGVRANFFVSPANNCKTLLQNPDENLKF